MLQVFDVSLVMDNLPIVENIDLEIAAGECVVMLGPSGCGKSTLLNLIAGLLVPDGGRVLLGGLEITGKTGYAGYMQQKHLLLPWLTLLDNCVLPLTLQGVPHKQARQRGRELMEIFGLAGFEDYYPNTLSGGMCQRGALLRTYLGERSIMLLDEPFANLDALTRRRLQEWLRQMQQRYKWSLLFVTHDIDEALYLGDRLYVLSSLPARVLKTMAVPEDRAACQEMKQEIWSLLEIE